jgi:hypothetical protein
MVEGKYRVTTGCNGERYLYFFPPGRTEHASLVADTNDDGLAVVCVVIGTEVAEMNVGTVKQLMWWLETGSYAEPGRASPQGDRGEKP